MSTNASAPRVALLWEELLSAGHVDPCHDQVEEEGPDPASTWEPTEASQALYSNSSRPAVSGRGA